VPLPEDVPLPEEDEPLLDVASPLVPASEPSGDDDDEHATTATPMARAIAAKLPR